MTLVSTIITDAFREGNILPITKAPTVEQSAEALPRLQAIILSVLGNEIGYVLEDWNVASATSILKPSGFAQDTTDFFVEPQSRLICNLTAPTTIDLDPQPQDGQRVSVVDAAANFGTNNLTLDGNGRLIEGGATVTLSTNGQAAQWFYRSDIATWVAIDTLAEADEMPFPSDFDDYFIIMLAMRLNPRYGRQMTQESAARLTQQRSQMILRYNQSRLRDATQMVSPQGGLAAKGEAA